MGLLDRLLRRPTEGASDHIDKAAARASELEARSQIVVTSLSSRAARNHWGESIASLARGDK